MATDLRFYFAEIARDGALKREAINQVCGLQLSAANTSDSCEDCSRNSLIMWDTEGYTFMKGVVPVLQYGLVHFTDSQYMDGLMHYLNGLP